MGEKMHDYAVKAVRPRCRPKKLGTRLQKNTERAEKCARKMLQTVRNGESYVV